MFTPVSNDIHIHSIMDESLPTTLIHHHQCKINPLSLQRLLLQCARPSSLFFSFVCLVFPSLFWLFFFFWIITTRTAILIATDLRVAPLSLQHLLLQYIMPSSLSVFFFFLILNLPLFSLAHHKPDHARASHDHASS
jgi:hypothetical protein